MKGIKTNLKKIMWFFVAALVLALTIRFIKVLPAFLKVLALLANVVAIYLAYVAIRSKSK